MNTASLLSLAGVASTAIPIPLQGSNSPSDSSLSSSSPTNSPSLTTASSYTSSSAKSHRRLASRTRRLSDARDAASRSLNTLAADLSLSDNHPIGATPIPIGKNKKRGQDFKCESCSKIYRHPSCLIKHRWEHTPHWRESSKYVLSKHQQVQLLEAAAILSHLSPSSTSLPEDRSLWPSFLSGGSLPGPNDGVPQAAPPAKRDRGGIADSKGFISTTTPNGFRLSSGIGYPISSSVPSGGPRMHDYSIPLDGSNVGVIGSESGKAQNTTKNGSNSYYREHTRSQPSTSAPAPTPPVTRSRSIISSSASPSPEEDSEEEEDMDVDETTAHAGHPHDHRRSTRSSSAYKFGTIGRGRKATPKRYADDEFDEEGDEREEDGEEDEEDEGIFPQAVEQWDGGEMEMDMD